MTTDPLETPASPAQFWEARYADADRVWSGRANATLVDVVSGLVPGRALDLGCGEGGDALWLARHDWVVTGVDISASAVARARVAATEAGVPENRLGLVVADLASWSGWTDPVRYDLVAVSFLHSPVELARADILRCAARLVAPGGHLFLLSHAAPPPWASGLHGHEHAFPTPAEEILDLDLDPADWETRLAEIRSRQATSPDGEPTILDDGVVLLRRRPRRRATASTG